MINNSQICSHSTSKQNASPISGPPECPRNVPGPVPQLDSGSAGLGTGLNSNASYSNSHCKLAGKPLASEMQKSLKTSLLRGANGCALDDSFLSLAKDTVLKSDSEAQRQTKPDRVNQENEGDSSNLNIEIDQEKPQLLKTPSKTRASGGLEFSFRKKGLPMTMSGQSNKTELGDFSGLYSNDLARLRGSPMKKHALLDLRSQSKLLFQSQQIPAPVTIESSLFPMGKSSKRKNSSLSPFAYYKNSKRDSLLTSPFFNEKSKMVFNTPKIANSPKPQLKKKLISPIFQVKGIRQPDQPGMLLKPGSSQLTGMGYLGGILGPLLEEPKATEDSPFFSGLVDSKLNATRLILEPKLKEKPQLNKSLQKQEGLPGLGFLMEDFGKNARKMEPDVRNQIMNNQHISFNRNTEISSLTKDIFDCKSDLNTKSKYNEPRQDSLNEFCKHDRSSQNKSELPGANWDEDKPRKDSNFSELMPRNACSLFSQKLQNLKKLEPKSKKSSSKKESEDFSSKSIWEDGFISKRSPRRLSPVLLNRSRPTKRVKILIREVNLANAKKSSRVNYFKKLSEKVLNRRQRNSKRVFLKERVTFFVREANYVRTFNPILFRPVEPVSEASLSLVSSNKDALRTIKDYFPALRAEVSQKPKVEGCNFIEQELQFKRHQQRQGKMSLNKFDFFRSQGVDGDDKKSCLHFEKGKKSVPKMMTPDLSFQMKKLGTVADNKRKQSMDFRHEREDWDSVQNVTPSKHIEDTVLKFQSQELKLTPAKILSNKSFLAYETPLLEADNLSDIPEDVDDQPRENAKRPAKLLGTYSIKSPFQLNNVEDLLNNQNVKIKCQDPRTKLKTDLSKKYYQRRETDSVILYGALQEKPRKNSPKYSSKHSEKRRRRPDAEEIEESQLKCNCRLTECLKRYCSCFSAGRVCGADCECQGCCNQENNPKRQAKLKKLRQRMGASNKGSDSKKKMGCKCSSSGCVKKYCECFRKGVFCMDSCRCVNCKNVRPLSPEL